MRRRAVVRQANLKVSAAMAITLERLRDERGKVEAAIRAVQWLLSANVRKADERGDDPRRESSHAGNEGA